jgi:hypothetical protein
MNRVLAEKLLATVFVIALFGGIYFLIQAFTAKKTESTENKITQTTSYSIVPAVGTEEIVPAVKLPKRSDKNQAANAYYYLEDFYVETGKGLVLKTHSDSDFSQILTTAQVERPVIEGPMLTFSEVQNGQSQKQYFNLEALLNQLNNAQ